MSIRSADIVRPLGVIEEFLWLFDHSSPKQFCLVAEVDGHTIVPEWRTALDALQERHPMLSVCIDSTYSRVPHFRRVTGQPIPLRIINADTPWEREAEREIRTLFEPAKAPLARAVLIHQPEKSVIILVLHHSIGDGISSVFLLRDLLSALAGQSLERLEFPPSVDDLLDVKPRITSKPGVNFSYALAEQCIEKPVHVKSAMLSPQLTQKIQERARKESTTVHAALCAAITIAGREIDQSWCTKPVSIFSPVNIRGLLRLQDQCMDAFSKASTLVETQSAPNLWELARFISTSLAPFKKLEGNQPGFEAIYEAMSSDMSVEEGAQFNRAAFSEDVMVSNLGLVPYDSAFGKLDIKSVWAPVFLRGHDPEQTIGVATINGSLHLVHTSWTPMPGLLERIERKLAESLLPSLVET